MFIELKATNIIRLLSICYNLRIGVEASKNHKTSTFKIVRISHGNPFTKHLQLAARRQLLINYAGQQAAERQLERNFAEKRVVGCQAAPRQVAKNRAATRQFARQQAAARQFVRQQTASFNFARQLLAAQQAATHQTSSKQKQVPLKCSKPVLRVAPQPRVNPQQQQAPIAHQQQLASYSQPAARFQPESQNNRHVNNYYPNVRIINYSDINNYVPNNPLYEENQSNTIYNQQTRLRTIGNFQPHQPQTSAGFHGSQYNTIRIISIQFSSH